MTTQNPPADPPEQAKATEPEAPEPTGFAVYDNTLLKFASGVVPTKAAANKLKAAGPKGHDLEVREV